MDGCGPRPPPRCCKDRCLQDRTSMHKGEGPISMAYCGTMRLLRVVAFIGVAVAAAIPQAHAQDLLTVEVDAREAPRRILHATVTMPVRPGNAALVYPKWLPGEHGPTGPVIDLVGLKLAAGGTPVPWRRDPLDMFRFLFDAPASAGTVTATFDFVSPPAAEGFSSGAAMTARVAVVAWNQVVLYPDGAASDAVRVRPRLRLPEG